MQRTYQLSEVPPTKADAAMAELLRRHAQARRFGGGSIIQQRGDSVEGFWLVESGSISICRFGLDGAVTIFGVLGSGDLYGELAHFGGMLRQVDVVAEEDSVLLWVDTPLIDRLMVQEPAFARWLLKSMANQLRIALERIHRDHGRTARARLAHLLHDLCRRNGPTLTMSQQELADHLGMSRVSVGQIVGQLVDEGIIQTGYRQIILSDAAGLEKYIER